MQWTSEFLSFVIAALAVEWQLTPSEMGWIGSVNSIGMAVGAFGFGMLADRIGRKNVFMMTLVLFSVASGLSALTMTLTAFLILRFFVGAGLGGELPVASTLVSESVEAHERGRVVVLLESFWAAGWLLAAFIAYFVIPNLWLESCVNYYGVAGILCHLSSTQIAGFSEI